MIRSKAKVGVLIGLYLVLTLGTRDWSNNMKNNYVEPNNVFNIHYHEYICHGRNMSKHCISMYFIWIIVIHTIV